MVVGFICISKGALNLHSTHSTPQEEEGKGVSNGFTPGILSSPPSSFTPRCANAPRIVARTLFPRIPPPPPSPSSDPPWKVPCLSSRTDGRTAKEKRKVPFAGGLVEEERLADAIFPVCAFSLPFRFPLPPHCRPVVSGEEEEEEREILLFFALCVGEIGLSVGRSGGEGWPVFSSSSVVWENGFFAPRVFGFARGCVGVDAICSRFSDQVFFPFPLLFPMSHQRFPHSESNNHARFFSFLFLLTKGNAISKASWNRNPNGRTED